MVRFSMYSGECLDDDDENDIYDADASANFRTHLSVNNGINAYNSTNINNSSNNNYGNAGGYLHTRQLDQVVIVAHPNVKFGKFSLNQKIKLKTFRISFLCSLKNGLLN